MMYVYEGMDTETKAFKCTEFFAPLKIFINIFRTDTPWKPVNPVDLRCYLRKCATTKRYDILE